MNNLFQQIMMAKKHTIKLKTADNLFNHDNFIGIVIIKHCGYPKRHPMYSRYNHVVVEGV